MFIRIRNCWVLEPALQGWGRPWVLCVRLCIPLLLSEVNNRGNTLFGCGVQKLHSRGFGPYTPHWGTQANCPKGSVCVHNTNATVEFAAG